MKKRVLGALLLGAMQGGAYAQSSGGVTLSGFVDLNIEQLWQSGANGGKVTRMSSGGLNNSRFNLSGFEELGGGNRAFFTYEPMFSANNGTQSAQARQSFVGLKGPWGEVSLGRQFTPSYWIAGYADPSWAADFSMVNNMEFFYASYRVDNAISYNTPRWNGLMARFMATTGVGDTTRAGRFLSAAVEYRNGGIFLGAVSELQYTRDIYSPSQIHSSRDNYFAATYKFGSVEPTLIYHTYNGYYAYPPYVAFNVRGWDVQAGVRYALTDRHRFYASFVHRQDDDNKALSNANGFVIGYMYGMSKRTTLYATYAHVQHSNDTTVHYPVTFQVTPNGNQNPSGVQLGIRHAF
ncbi:MULTISPECIES: porin [unclassified Pandoraea]|uniref:porin n=1 Tax=unclassified Pandoraea TaxID=2624094 RepID=UPI000B3FD19E|nr:MULTISPECIES: porin [unclassified Pandoraea]